MLRGQADFLIIGGGIIGLSLAREGDRRSFHVLNAVSPAFTCAIPFSEFLFDQFERMQLAA